MLLVFLYDDPNNKVTDILDYWSSSMSTDTRTNVTINGIDMALQSYDDVYDDNSIVYTRNYVIEQGQYKLAFSFIGIAEAWLTTVDEIINSVQIEN